MAEGTGLARPARGRALTALLAAVGLLGCGQEPSGLPPTGVLVVIRADDEVCSRVGELALQLEGADASGRWQQGPGTSLEVEDCTSWPKQVAVRPRDEEASRQFRLTVRAYARGRRHPEPPWLVTRVQSGFVEGRWLKLEVVLYGSCAASEGGETCGEEEQCGPGGCEPLQPVDPRRLPDAWPQDGGRDAAPPEAGPDAAMDAEADAGPEAGPDAEMDAGADAQADAGMDAAMDAEADGGVRSCDDAADCEDDNPCTVDECTDGACRYVPRSAGTSCPGGSCDGSGRCNECTEDSDCAWGMGCDVSTGRCRLCVEQVSAESSAYVCVRTRHGKVFCWGNREPRCGDPLTRPVEIPLSGRAVHVQTAGNWWVYACALLEADRSIWCWGYNHNGRMCSPDATVNTCIWPPARADWGTTSIEAFLLNSQVSYVRSADGELRACGANGGGWLGVGDTMPRMGPVTVPGWETGTASLAVSGNTNLPCAIRSDGTLWCWGANNRGQLGQGTTGASQATPVQVPIPGDEAVVQVAGGYWSVCAITVSGKLYCWGQAEDGALGLGPPADLGDNVTSPTEVTGFDSTVQQVRLGFQHGCAVTASGRLYCWGKNSAGELGMGDKVSRWTPTWVESLGSEVESVVTTGYHAGPDQVNTAFTCALLRGGRLYCWGGNNAGQLGLGDRVQRLLPTSVAPGCAPP